MLRGIQKIMDRWNSNRRETLAVYYRERLVNIFSQEREVGQAELKRKVVTHSDIPAQLDKKYYVTLNWSFQGISILRRIFRILNRTKIQSEK